MKEGYHIQVLRTVRDSPTSYAEKVYFELKAIKSRHHARDVFRQLSAQYSEPTFVVKCHHTEHTETILDLEDF